jgi:DNA-binding NtrC family response regulator
MGKILVVDDSEHYRDYLMTLLHRAGYEVDSLPNGVGVAARVAAGDISAVITDLHMPGRDGIETVSDVKRQSPGVPVIGVIGMGIWFDDSYVRVMQLLGAEAVLVKPIDETALLDILRRAISTEAASRRGAA